MVTKEFKPKKNINPHILKLQPAHICTIVPAVKAIGYQKGLTDGVKGKKQ
jgi:hypothetical protein